MAKKFWITLLGGLVVFIVGAGIFWLTKPKIGILSPLGEIIDQRPLDKYTYENLRKRSYRSSEIKFERILKQTPEFSTWLFFFDSDGKRISGVANLPIRGLFGGSFPIVIMIHGFAEVKGYYSGFGTERVAGELAKNGYITLAPDFAGYGQSASASADSFEDRFQTYTTTLNLVASAQKYCLPDHQTTSLPQDKSGSQVDGRPVDCRIGLWGHSNGGQIALSVLEISGKSIPTVLWNPVSKFFPYNILYYIDQFDDRGKWLRGALAKFEEKYDTDKYSLDKFWSWIRAPILLQQGSADRDVPKFWSDELNDSLTKQATRSAVTYKVYPGADHNMLPGWDQAVADLLLFYKKNL